MAAAADERAVASYERRCPGPCGRTLPKAAFSKEQMWKKDDEGKTYHGSEIYGTLDFLSGRPGMSREHLRNSWPAGSFQRLRVPVPVS